MRDDTSRTTDNLFRTTIILIMNALHFYNGDRQLEIVFSKFQVQKNKPDFNDFVSFQINVKHSFVSTSINTECLDIDLVNFVIDLRKLYKMEVKTVSFVQTIEKNIEITFNLNELGQILVRVIIRKQIDNITVVFEYGTDQSFLPELINEIEIIINEMGITN